MECRCYHGGEGRTRLRQLKYHRLDRLTLVLALGMCAVVVILDQYGL